MVSKPIPDLGVRFVWPCNPVRHNEDIMSAWGREGVFVTSHIGYGGKFLKLYKYGLFLTL